MPGDTRRPYPPELRERAVRMVAEIRNEQDSESAAMTRVSQLLGVGTPETVGKWRRDFAPAAPDRLWVADITYVRRVVRRPWRFGHVLVDRVVLGTLAARGCTPQADLLRAQLKRTTDALVGGIGPAIAQIARRTSVLDLCRLRYIAEWVIIDSMDAVLHALADRHRRVLVEALCSGEATAGELGALVPVSQPGVSRHLSVLKEAGLVEVRPEGQRRIYRLRREGLEPVSEWLLERQRVWEQRMDALHTEVARGIRQRKENP